MNGGSDSMCRLGQFPTAGDIGRANLALDLVALAFTSFHVFVVVRINNFETLVLVFRILETYYYPII